MKIIAGSAVAPHSLCLLSLYASLYRTGGNIPLSLFTSGQAFLEEGLWTHIYYTADTMHRYFCCYYINSLGVPFGSLCSATLYMTLLVLLTYVLSSFCWKFILCCHYLSITLTSAPEHCSILFCTGPLCLHSTCRRLTAPPPACLPYTLMEDAPPACYTWDCTCIFCYCLGCCLPPLPLTLPARTPACHLDALHLPGVPGGLGYWASGRQNACHFLTHHLQAAAYFLLPLQQTAPPEDLPALPHIEAAAPARLPWTTTAHRLPLLYCITSLHLPATGGLHLCRRWLSCLWEGKRDLLGGLHLQACLLGSYATTGCSPGWLHPACLLTCCLQSTMFCLTAWENLEDRTAWTCLTLLPLHHIPQEGLLLLDSYMPAYRLPYTSSTLLCNLSATANFLLLLLLWHLHHCLWRIPALLGIRLGGPLGHCHCIFYLPAAWDTLLSACHSSATCLPTLLPAPGWDSPHDRFKHYACLQRIPAILWMPPAACTTMGLSANSASTFMEDYIGSWTSSPHTCYASPGSLRGGLPRALRVPHCWISETTCHPPCLPPWTTGLPPQRLPLHTISGLQTCMPACLCLDNEYLSAPACCTACRTTWDCTGLHLLLPPAAACHLLPGTWDCRFRLPACPGGWVLPAPAPATYTASYAGGATARLPHRDVRLYHGIPACTAATCRLPAVSATSAAPPAPSARCCAPACLPDYRTHHHEHLLPATCCHWDLYYLLPAGIPYLPGGRASCGFTPYLYATKPAAYHHHNWDTWDILPHLPP